MSDGFQYFDIIIFAMIAAFLVLRLRSVLGRRTGTEKPREFRPLAKPATDNVVNLPEGLRSREELAPPPSGPRADSPETGLAQIRNVDPKFDPDGFALEAKETLETHLVAIKAAEIDEAELNGRTAFVTVKFVSDQVNVTRAADGKIIEGEPDHVVEKTDFWTFARNTRSQDPNWLLVATRSA